MRGNYLDDTIAAIATPLGSAGIGIVRISGPEALALADKIFISKQGKKPSALHSHTLVYGYIVDLVSGGHVDEALLTVMRAPSTYTMEDVVEINCHGGTVATRKTLETVLKAGARLAEPGEFTKRAFLNGRIDLAQAESVMDVINAKTEGGLQVALGQLEGGLSRKVTEARDSLLGLLARIEAGIDFPEHEIEELSRQEMEEKARDIVAQIEHLLNSADTGKVYREGINTVIVGKPNVGKSSLLNALLREKRAIVTDVPGTTRDLIEEVLNIRGIPLKLVDTAGIRETEDFVEQLGVEKSREILGKADLVLFVIDAVSGFNAEDRSIYEQIKGKKTIFIINKSDLVDEGALEKIDLPLNAGQTNGISTLSTRDNTPGEGESVKGTGAVVIISALHEMGLDRLEEEITSLVLAGEVATSEGAIVSNVRHKNALYRSLGHLKDALRTLEEGQPLDLAAIDFRDAWEALGEISGDTVDEDIIDRIFADFCIGK